MLKEFHVFLKQRHYYCHCFKKSLREKKKNMTSTGSHAYTCTQRNLHTCTYTGRYRHTVPPKRHPNRSSCWFYQSVILSEVPHNGPTPHLASCCTKAPPLSSFPHILRQGRRAPCGRAFEALSTQPASTKMRLHYSPEKRARFSHRSKCIFPGNDHSQTHRTAWLLWISL